MGMIYFYTLIFDRIFTLSQFWKFIIVFYFGRDPVILVWAKVYKIEIQLDSVGT